jgi:hypothetical protein
LRQNRGSNGARFRAGAIIGRGDPIALTKALANPFWFVLAITNQRNKRDLAGATTKGLSTALVNRYL